MVGKGIIDAKQFLQDAMDVQSRYDPEIESMTPDPEFLAELEWEDTGNQSTQNSTAPPPLAEFLLPKHPSSRTRVQNELVYTITFYPPRSSHRHLIKQQQYQFLGSQTLYFLRDYCFCFTDHIRIGVDTQSHTPPSSFVYIENTFYVDDRVDYEDMLETLHEFWNNLDEKDSQLNSMVCHTMATRLIDIPLQIDQIYLLHHQYTCGHAFKVNEIRVHHDQVDHTYAEEYPFVLYFATIYPPTCTVCKLSPPLSVAYGCYKGPYDGSLWCSTCLDTHYPNKDLELYSYELDLEFTV
jgi:hypothetical protein